MRIKLSYVELSGILGYVNTILADKTVDEKKKNVIFLVNGEDVTVVGYSPLTFSRAKLNNCEVFDVEDTWDFQVKANDLNKIMGSYASLYKTKVENVEFEKAGNKVKLIIHEEAINEEDARLSQTGRFLLDDIPIMESIKKEIHISFPEESDTIMSEELLLYIDSLFPLMNNDSASSLASKLQFSKDYVYVLASYINSFFINKLPDAFKGLTLGYSSVSFLKKLCEGVEDISVQRIDRYLCIQSGLIEAFLKYQNVKVKEDKFVREMSNDTGIVLDRLYLKDVLKRMLVASQDGVAQITEDGLEVSNSGFNQVIPINNRKGEVDNLKFKLSVTLMMKTIIGDDSVFKDELFLYFVKAGVNGYKDATGAWFSSIQVRI